VENTVPFDIRKFRKVKPEFLVEWNAPKNIRIRVDGASEDYRTSRAGMCSRARSHMISSGDNKRNQTCFLCLEEKTQREKVVDSLID